MEWLDETPHPSHPGMFCQLLLESFKLVVCSTEKKVTNLSLLNFHPKTTGRPRMVDSAL
jgi:hypothetical protein